MAADKDYLPPRRHRTAPPLGHGYQSEQWSHGCRCKYCRDSRRWVRCAECLGKGFDASGARCGKCGGSGRHTA